jgi:activator of HSP90 ATPase
MILIIFRGAGVLANERAGRDAMRLEIETSRRHLMLGGMMVLGSAVLAKAAPGNKAAVITGAIRQQADFAASPAHIFKILTDEKLFAAMSGAPATIENREGGAFSLFGGAITGRNLELVDAKRVVQAWYDTAWPAGLYSVIRFELAAAGSGTHVNFEQAGFPESDRASLEAGWHSHYWDPMKAYLRKG